MKVLEILRLRLLMVLGIDPFKFLSLQFSMKQLPPHKLVAEFSPPVEVSVPRLFSQIPLTVSVPQRLVIEVADVRVSGSKGHLYHGDSLISESTSWPPAVALLSKVSKKSQRDVLPGTFLVLGEAPYYHFLVENFALTLSLLGEVPDATVLAPESKTRYLNDALQLLPPKTNVRRYDRPVELERVILATRHETLGRPQPREIRSLIELGEGRPGLKSLFEDSPLLIYISRRKSKRSITDERGLEDHLKTLGFQIVFAEDMSVGDQIDLFRRCRVVVGPHGAGLTNIVFAPSGALVVELLDPKYPNHCFEILAKACNHDFRRILVDPDERGFVKVATEIERMLA